MCGRVTSRGDQYSVQGNILAGEEVVRAMARSFESTNGELAERLMAVLEAGQAAGGDARGMQGGSHLGDGTVRPDARDGRLGSISRRGHSCGTTAPTHSRSCAAC